MKTTFPQKKDLLKRNWYLIDAKEQILGKVAAISAHILRGKHKAIFSPHLDCGDHIIIINADYIKTTGKKLNQKIYYKHSGYLGHLKETTLKDMLLKDSTKVLEHAISGMLPRNRLKKHVLSKLKIYKDEKFPHDAQKPIKLAVPGRSHKP